MWNCISYFSYMWVFIFESACIKRKNTPRNHKQPIVILRSWVGIQAIHVLRKTIPSSVVPEEIPAAM